MKSRLLRLVAALFVLAASANAQEAKESALKLLEQSFDYVIAVLPQVTTEQLKRTRHIPSWKGRNDPDGLGRCSSTCSYTQRITARSANSTCALRASSRPIIHFDWASSHRSSQPVCLGLASYGPRANWAG